MSENTKWTYLNIMLLVSTKKFMWTIHKVMVLLPFCHMMILQWDPDNSILRLFNYTIPAADIPQCWVTLEVIMKNGHVKTSKKAITVKVIFQVLPWETEENYKGQPVAQSRLNLHNSWIQVYRVFLLNQSAWQMGLSSDNGELSGVK